MTTIQSSNRVSRAVAALIAAALTIGLLAAPAAADPTTDTGTGTGHAAAAAADTSGVTAVARITADANIDDVLAELSDELESEVTASSLIASRNVYVFRIAVESASSNKREDAREDLVEELEELDDDMEWIATDRDDLVTAPTRFHAWPVQSTWDEATVDQTLHDAFELAPLHAVARGEGTLVAVIDSGFDTTHPALAGRFVDGYDLIEDDADVADVMDGLDNDGDGQIDEGYGHGTFVAGLVLKVAPDARVLPIRALDSDGTARSHTITEAVHLAIDRGADVINLSFGMVAGDEPKELRNALKRARKADVVVVVAAGNSNEKDPKLIGHSEKAISVAASTTSGEGLASFSSYGKKVTVAAPGLDVVSAVPGGGFATWSGSSMAAPIVAGQAALLMSLAPDASDGDVRNWIKKSARDQGKTADKRKTKEGLIDLGRSFERLIDDEDLDIDFDADSASGPR